jgi:hypothetical protein
VASADLEVPIVVRADVDLIEVDAILKAISVVAWSDFQHAYGPADDVKNQLAAVAVGDDATRKAAWWNLWGNIHHQGTIYGAAVPAVPILGSLSSWHAYPDRAQAILLLREIGAARGVVAWHYDTDNAIVHDEEAQQDLWVRLVSQMDQASLAALDSWRDDPPDVRRALVHLLTALPKQREQYGGLVEEVMPVHFRHAWLASHSELESPEMNDEIDEYEQWVYAG